MASQPIVKSSSTPEGFVRIGDGIWFVKVDQPELKIDESHPTLILIFGWMDAKVTHIAKFSAGYRKIYPNTPQITVSSTGEWMYRSQSYLQQKMKPLLDQLIALKVLGETREPHRILTHLMSNGGAIRLNHLAQFLALPANAKYTPVPNQPSAMVLDSSPGGDNIKSADLVFQVTMPSPFIRYPFMTIAYSIHFISYIFGFASWGVFDGLRQDMLNPRWLPWITPASSASNDSATPYLFIYSKADRLVPFNDLQTFTERAESNGILVWREIYEDTPHVGHMRADPVSYWAAIERHWKRAIHIE